MKHIIAGLMITIITASSAYALQYSHFLSGRDRAARAGVNAYIAYELGVAYGTLKLCVRHSEAQAIGAYINLKDNRYFRQGRRATYRYSQARPSTCHKYRQQAAVFSTIAAQFSAANLNAPSAGLSRQSIPYIKGEYEQRQWKND